MYERNRRNFNNRGVTRTSRIRRSRERTPPRQRSPFVRERSRSRFERRSHERFSRRSKDRSEARFERARSIERFEPPRKLIDEAGRFEPPPRDVIDQQRSFENERYVPPSPRFEERVEAVEPPMVERNLNFECPTDFAKFPGEGRYYDGANVNNASISPRPILESTPNYPARQTEENNDKPDPWNSGSGPSSSSQLQPTFGQEKGSNLIPEFDPETSDITVNAFLKLIDKVGQDKSWSGHDRKFQFSMKLRGAAKEWFLNGNKFLDSWSSIKKQFRSTFPADMDFYQLLTNMIQRVKRPDEDLSSYFNYKIVLLKNCNITGKKAVSCLIGGLPDAMEDVKSNALDKNFATAEELYKFLIDEHIEEEQNRESHPKCFSSLCGKRGSCDCHKSELRPIQDEGAPRKIPLKCYKDIYVTGRKLKCLFDEDFPHITIRESDIDFLKIRYRRQITLINGYDRTNITALGQTQFLLKIDELFTEMPFYVVKDNIQDTPVLMGRVALKFPHTTNRNGIFFTADENVMDIVDRPEGRGRSNIELRRGSRSPIRRSHDHEMLMRRSTPERGINRSPRRSPPGRAYKETPLFISQFYGKRHYK